MINMKKKKEKQEDNTDLKIGISIEIKNLNKIGLLVEIYVNGRRSRIIDLDGLTIPKIPKVSGITFSLTKHFTVK